ncbi:MAG: hypothetical protein PWQ50_1575 [Methanolobus sp.]|jgi:hypothetical protein|nr:hypothetical protein [Methanolobus sp.]
MNAEQNRISMIIRLILNRLDDLFEDYIPMYYVNYFVFYCGKMPASPDPSG